MFNITDLLITPRNDQNLLLSEDQHLLRRFGAIYSHFLQGGETLQFNATNESDEIWNLISGDGIIKLVDKRERSPSNGLMDEIALSENNPMSLLVLFGIEKNFSAISNCHIIRVVSHYQNNE